MSEHFLGLYPSSIHDPQPSRSFLYSCGSSTGGLGLVLVSLHQGECTKHATPIDDTPPPVWLIYFFSTHWPLSFALLMAPSVPAWQIVLMFFRPVQYPVERWSLWHSQKISPGPYSSILCISMRPAWIFICGVCYCLHELNVIYCSSEMFGLINYATDGFGLCLVSLLSSFWACHIILPAFFPVCLPPLTLQQLMS